MAVVPIAMLTGDPYTALRDASISAADYDAVFYPGGHGPLGDLSGDRDSITLIEAMYAAGKPLAAVCHAPGVFRLVKAPKGSFLVEGKAVTGFANTEEEAVGLTTAGRLGDGESHGLHR